MTELILYHIAPSRSLIAQWMLEEIGRPYELRVLDSKKGENREPAYLAVNPMGKVPALVHDGVTITEAAAICTYLADAFPEAGLSIPIGDKRRGPYLKWLFFGPSCLEPAVLDRMRQLPPGDRGMLGYGDFETVMNVIGKAVEQGPYLFGDQFTAADVVLGSGLLWGMMVNQVPARPDIKAYTDRLGARAACRKIFAGPSA